METISLAEAYNRSIEREKLHLGKLNDTTKNLFSLLSLSEVNRIYFLYSAFEEQNFQKGKDYLYKTAMCESYYLEICKMNAYDALNTFTFPVLSDSSEVINRYSIYPFPAMKYAKDSFNTRFSQAIQAVLKDDKDSLVEHIDMLQKRSKKGWQKQYVGVVTCFEGLLSENKELIEEGIYELLKTHNKQNPNTIDSKYINYEATTIAKLAYRKGIEVKIDNPLVPAELLPVKELEAYKGYDFLKDLDKLCIE